MPPEEIYQPRIMPQAAAAMPLANASAYGAGLADAIGGAGDTLERSQLREQQRQIRIKDTGKQLRADTELTEGAKRLADQTATLEVEQKRLGLEHGPDYLTQVNEGLQRRREAVTDGVTDPRVLQHLTRQLNDMDARDRGQAEMFDLGKQIERNRNNVETMRATLDNGIRNAADPFKALNDALRQSGDFLGGLELTDDETSAAIGREWRGQFTGTALGKLAETDPDQVDTLLKSGRLNDVLTEKQMVNAKQAVDLGRQAREVAAHEAEQAAARAAEQQRKDAVDRLQAYEIMTDKGEPPSQADIGAALTALRDAGGDRADQAKYAYMAEDAARAPYLIQSSTADLQRRAGGLRLQQDAGQLDAPRTRELRQIDRTLDARARNAGATLGQLWKSDQLGVAAQLRAMPRADQELAASQLDPRALVLARMDADVADRVHYGGEVRKAQPKEFMPIPRGEKEGDPKLADADFDAYLGPTLRHQLGPAYTAMLGAAKDFYVGSQARGGAAAGWNAQNFHNSIRRVFGGSVRRGGEWQGGVDQVKGHMVELPDRWTTDEFDHAYSRLDLAKAGAIYANGRPVDNADVRANYQPVVLNQGDDGTVFYRLQDANGRPLKRNNGRDFVLVIPPNPQVR